MKEGRKKKLERQILILKNTKTFLLMAHSRIAIPSPLRGVVCVKSSLEGIAFSHQPIETSNCQVQPS